MSDQQTPENPAPVAGEGTLAPPALPFKLEEIDDTFELRGEEARNWLQARAAQLESGYTKALLPVQEQAKQIESLLALKQQMASDDTRQAAVQSLLAEYGLEIEWDGAPEPPSGDEQAPDETLAQYEQRIAKLEADAAQRADDARGDEFKSRALGELHEFAQAEGYETLEELPAFMRESVVSFAGAVPHTEDGFLDIAEGVRRFHTMRDGMNEHRRTKRQRAKDVPVPDLGSQSADPAVVRGDQRSRLERMNAVAGRHY